MNTVVTIEQLTYELEEARRLATARGNASAAVLAIVAKARLHGLFNRDQAPLPNTIVAATAERQQSPREIARLIAFALAIGRQQRLAGQE